jgi:hypothetical protein
MKITLLTGLLLIPAFLYSQIPEKQISFAHESKSHSYYVEQDRFKNLDTYLQELEHEDSFSGIVVIAKNGETLFSKTIGFADIFAVADNVEKILYN